MSRETKIQAAEVSGIIGHHTESTERSILAFLETEGHFKSVAIYSKFDGALLSCLVSRNDIIYGGSGTHSR